MVFGCSVGKGLSGFLGFENYQGLYLEGLQILSHLLSDYKSERARENTHTLLRKRKYHLTYIHAYA